MSTAFKRFSPQEYLALERQAEHKSEFFDGEIFAMAGASRAHSLISSNLVRILGNDLVERPCEVHGSDMRVKVKATGLYTYPDVSVVCGEPRYEDAEVDTLLNPKALVEVLSKSTEAYDRGRKAAHYRRLESLSEYMLVSQDEYRVELYTRLEDGRWLFSEARGLEAEIELTSLGCRLPLSEIYRRVTIDAAAADNTPPAPSNSQHPDSRP